MDSSPDVDEGVLEGQPSLISAIRHHVGLVLLVTLIGMVLAAGATLATGKSYLATAEIFLGNPNASTVFRSIPVGQPAAQALSAAQLMRSDQVLGQARDILLRNGRPGDLSGVSVIPSASSAEVTIQATAANPHDARDRANAVGQAFLDVSKAQRQTLANRTDAVLKTSVSDLTSQSATLRQKITELTMAAEQRGAAIIDPTSRARFVQTVLNSDQNYQSLQSRLSVVNATLASVQQKEQQTAIDASVAGGGADTFLAAPLPQAAPTLKRNLALGAVIGFLLGAGMAWRRAEQRHLATDATISRALDAPQLGLLPTVRSLVRGRGPGLISLTPGTQPGDDLKVMAAILMTHADHDQFDRLVVTSANPREGRTTLALNLAVAAAAMDRNVVLVDADVRHHALSDALGFGNAPGLTDVVARRETADGVMATTPAPDGRELRFIPAGTHNAAGKSLPAGWRLSLPGPTRAEALIAIVDAPCAVDDPAALQLNPQGVALVVAVSPASSPGDLRTLRARAVLAGVPILGFIAIDLPSAGVMKPRSVRFWKRQAEPDAPADPPVDAIPSVPVGAGVPNRTLPSAPVGHDPHSATTR